MFSASVTPARRDDRLGLEPSVLVRVACFAALSMFVLSCQREHSLQPRPEERAASGMHVSETSASATSESNSPPTADRPVAHSGLSANIMVTSAGASSQDECRGCTLVSARVSGGQPPYTLHWNTAALSGAESQRFCPQSTFLLRLDVTDSTAGGEFGPGTLSASVETTIAPANCAPFGDAAIGTADAGASPEFDASRAQSDAAFSEPPDAAAHDTGTAFDAGTAVDAAAADAAGSPDAAMMIDDAATVPDADLPVCACSNEPPNASDSYLLDPSFEQTGAPASALPNWQTCSGSPSRQPSGGGAQPAPLPVTAAFGESFAVLPTASSMTMKLSRPIQSGQHYWMSWAAAMTGTFTPDAPGSALFNMWLGNAPCQQAQAIADEPFHTNLYPEWVHYCSQFVAEGDADYITLAAQTLASLGRGAVSIDQIRIEPYDFETRYMFGIRCEHVPLGMPFR